MYQVFFYFQRPRVYVYFCIFVFTNLIFMCYIHCIGMVAYTAISDDRIRSSCIYCTKAWISSTFPQKNRQTTFSLTLKLVRKLLLLGVLLMVL